MTQGLFLSQADSRPMYLQIVEQVKRKILAGDWPPGQALPSIRELAATTSVSVITVKRAYSELEAEGVIRTRPGLGSFVADDSALQATLESELVTRLDALLSTADQLGLDDRELLARLERALNTKHQR